MNMPNGLRWLPLLLLALLLPWNASAHDTGTAGPETPLPTWTDPATGLEFIRIPGGCFLMGSPLSEPGHEPGEERRRVCLDPFWISRTEVTRGQFAAFVKNTNYVAQSTKQDWVRVWDHRWENVYGSDWRDPGMEQTDQHPVAGVSYSDAEAMARWMRRQSGHHIALPTEEQWEYAARAGTTTSRWWSNEYDKQICTYANVGDLTNLAELGRKRQNPMPSAPCRDGFPFSAPVASFQPNPWGLHDMFGNVQEWVRTDRKTQYNENHLLCGGHFLSFDTDIRAAKREDPSLEYGVYFFMGFRLVRTD
ncbi:Formylglycine-generating enzyme, required for sulfatase activity, contains SUMF1/FGE domain [Paucidesulfovibrio gracilis DSM 16080]|uniref:Formylglycine-generating enzyme, required for sulfatase activity, contains SUMF1/FGE domain n=1 Tax=Paucidesulfovibrio gracilis DSM 16080 TaxID=1121449 RepID=A0A1T4Y816_9BACT|nr:SUMF1/EgtB/PvdO family nonheme iron enzyme [Paucidesulfovibrio gracilis]SKA97668.1 Formylglycine-generating enzyme, required for sulfatase activity, contains SUMF1/FGE domain [Paucidesulfovibrio gracilis DSM 16080]